MSYSKTKSKQVTGGWRIYFSEKPLLEILDLSLYPKKFWRKKAFIHENSTNLCDILWKLQSQKPRPIEIPHQFYLNILGISRFFLIHLWNFGRNFHMFFLQGPQKFHTLIPPPTPLFFWNSPIIAQVLKTPGQLTWSSSKMHIFSLGIQRRQLQAQKV